MLHHVSHAEGRKKVPVWCASLPWRQESEPAVAGSTPANRVAVAPAEEARPAKRVAAAPGFVFAWSADLMLASRWQPGEPGKKEFSLPLAVPPEATDEQPMYAAFGDGAQWQIPGVSVAAFKSLCLQQR